ncbi:MAG: hypothetical protein K1X78_13465 [Verrucomicrobiaceae bacterium]|nr:hypothetical protein [Verrucomicrobiaceae bacterium]
MRAKSHRFSGVILMILLLTAQTMGWCRAYVCECFGTPEVTMLDHCHCWSNQDHEHENPSEPCNHQCGEHRDHHQVLGSRLNATSPRGERENEKTNDPAFSLAPLPAIEPVFQLSARHVALLDRANHARSDISRRPRLTVALLI